MKYLDLRAGSAECDVNPLLGRVRGDDWSFGEYSIHTDLTDEETFKVEAVMVAARAAKDAEGKRVFNRIPVPLAIAIVKVLGSADPSEAALALVTSRQKRGSI